MRRLLLRTGIGTALILLFEGGTKMHIEQAAGPQVTSKGFSRPTTTPTPDELFDIWLPQLSGSELKVLLYIVRRTMGFKKDADTISISQICSGIRTRDGRVLDQGTGLSRNTVIQAIKGLTEKGLVRVERGQDERGIHETNTYRLRFRGDDDDPSDEGDLSPDQGSAKTEPGVVQKSNYGSAKNDPGVV
ncbi:MAG: replication protein, partial [Anaerolineae bacterium]|nr:replication protein [Anaerolineae bacterium]